MSNLNDLIISEDENEDGGSSADESKVNKHPTVIYINENDELVEE